MQAWKPKFLLDGKPLPLTACVRMWEKGEEGRIAQTLAKGLLLPDDVHAFKEGSKESMGRRLQWHTVGVTLYLPIPYCHLHIYYFSFTFHFVTVLIFVFVRLLNWPIFWMVAQRNLLRRLTGRGRHRRQLLKQLRKK